MWTFLKRAAVALVALASAFTAAPQVAAHGYLAEPASRNFQRKSNYCEHCLAAGGPGLTFADGRKWPNSQHGVCGDPITGPFDHEGGGKFATPPKIAAVYTQGQVITIKIVVTAWHGGRFSFGMCPVDGASGVAERRVATQQCFDLNRLEQVSATAGPPSGPIGPAFKYHYWLPVGDTAPKTGTFEMQFKLPAGLTCKRCVLQWHWETGNSCSIPGTPGGYEVSPNLVPCDQTNVMEEFWNCADVSIVGNKPPKPKPKAGSPKQRKKEAFVTGLDQQPRTAGDLLAACALACAVACAVACAAVPVTLAVGGALAGAVWYLSPRPQQSRPWPPLLLTAPRPARHRIFSRQYTNA